MKLIVTACFFGGERRPNLSEKRTTQVDLLDMTDELVTETLAERIEQTVSTLAADLSLL